jgi:hypothetical protein
MTLYLCKTSQSKIGRFIHKKVFYSFSNLAIRIARIRSPWLSNDQSFQRPLISLGWFFSEEKKIISFHPNSTEDPFSCFLMQTRQWVADNALGCQITVNFNIVSLAAQWKAAYARMHTRLKLLR